METNEEVSQSSSKSNNNPQNTTEVIADNASDKETINVLSDKINTMNINTTQQVIKKSHEFS